MWDMSESVGSEETLADMRAWRVNDVRRNDVVCAAHASGWAINRIGGEMGIDRKTVYRILDAA